MDDEYAYVDQIVFNIMMKCCMYILSCLVKFLLYKPVAYQNKFVTSHKSQVSLSLSLSLSLILPLSSLSNQSNAIVR